jgi:hypothetical protein
MQPHWAMVRRPVRSVLWRRGSSLGLGGFFLPPSPFLFIGGKNPRVAPLVLGADAGAPGDSGLPGRPGPEGVFPVTTPCMAAQRARKTGHPPTKRGAEPSKGGDATAPRRPHRHRPTETRRTATNQPPALDAMSQMPILGPSCRLLSVCPSRPGSCRSTGHLRPGAAESVPGASESFRSFRPYRGAETAETPLPLAVSGRNPLGN